MGENGDQGRSCSSCGGKLAEGDLFCPACGKTAADGLEAGAASASDPDRQKRIRRAANWILAIAILFVVFGTGFGVYHHSQAREAKVSLAQFSDDMLVPEPVYGKQYRVGELRELIDREVFMVFATNYFLAVVMLGLYFWARRSAFAAIVTALTVYLAVIVFSAIADPKTLVQGILIKILFIGALIAGLKAALQERAAAAPAGPAAPGGELAP